MKYILFVLLLTIIGLLLFPIIIFKWDDNGMDSIVEGLRTMLNI